MLREPKPNCKKKFGPLNRNRKMLSATPLEDCDGNSLRQIPPFRLLWSRTLWIDEHGEVMRARTFNPHTRSWAWGAVTAASIDGRGRSGFWIEGHFCTVAQAIALAWVPRETPQRRLQAVVCRKGNAITADNLQWRDEQQYDEDDDIELEDDEDDDPRRVRWLPLKLQVGLVRCDRDDCFISTTGLLRTPFGIERGVYARSQRVASIPSIGMIPLQTVVDLVFNGKRPLQPPYIRRAIRALREHTRIAKVATALGVKESTAWTYAYHAAQHMSFTSAQRLIERLLPRVLVESMRRLVLDVPDVVLGAPLRDVVILVTRAMAADLQWKSDRHRYSKVCSMRSLLQREVVSRP